jgi:hypothetical protein
MSNDMREEEGTLMDGVTEYAERYEVRLVKTTGSYVGIGKEMPGAGRLVIKAMNEAGNNCTEVDLLEVLSWVKANRPDLMA